MQKLATVNRRFIDLHFTRSKTRSTLFILHRTSEYQDNSSCFLSAELSLPSEDGLEGGGAIFQKQIPLSEGVPYIHMLEFVNGLICFICNETRCVRIYNPSTRESTPWIKSLIKQQHEDEMPFVVDEYGRMYCRCAYITFWSWSYFGYNPATKEHKVLTLWLVCKKDKYGNLTSEETICEILTIGGKQQNNSFRMVDDAHAPLVSPHLLGKSVYVNSSIYWYRPKPSSDGVQFIPDWDGGGLSIIEFNCGTEKFREISIPNSITDICRFGHTRLMEVDGLLTLLAKKGGENSEVREHMKMYLLHNNNDNQSSKSHWVEETFLVPPFEWKPNKLGSILPIPGTDFFIVRSATNEVDFSFYYYNWKMKKYSSNKVEMNGISLVSPDGDPLCPSLFRFYTFTENLQPVNYGVSPRLQFGGFGKRGISKENTVMLCPSSL